MWLCIIGIIALGRHKDLLVIWWEHLLNRTIVVASSSWVELDAGFSVDCTKVAVT